LEPPEFEKLLKCLGGLLSQGGYALLGGCGLYNPNEPPDFFAKCLKKMAGIIGKKVCACTGWWNCNTDDCWIRCGKREVRLEDPDKVPSAPCCCADP
jgi:hypothetical protein